MHQPGGRVEGGVCTSCNGPQLGGSAAGLSSEWDMLEPDCSENRRNLLEICVEGKTKKIYAFWQKILIVWANL